MNYQLLRKLKDSGFNQNIKSSGNITGICKHGNIGFSLIRESCDCRPEDTCYEPKLSELIEACGLFFSELNKITHTKQPQKWLALSYPCEECEIENMNTGYGSTPEEAVARLWLKINKK